jgi:hypothetical protein
VTHDALRKTPPTLWNSTVLRATAAAPECLQLHRQVVPTRRRTSEHRVAGLYMAACRPMARQSGYSKYEQGAQRLARNLWDLVVSIVRTLPEVTSRQPISDAMMLSENTEVRTMAAQNTYGRVISQSGGGTCLSAVKQSLHCEIWDSNGVVF